MARLALLPARFGGLGLQCAERVAPAAYWAAWADALPVLRLHRPEAAERCLAELEAGPASFALCLRAAAAAGAHLTHAGWRVGPCGALSMTACDRPNATCLSLASGARAGSITVLATPSCCRPLRRPRRRCCVRSLGRALPHGSAPSPARPAQQCRQTMLIALRRRLRLPLPIAPGRCGAHGPGCGAAVDVYGDHYAACPRTGLLARQAKPLERAWIRVVREAVGPKGKVVPQQWLVRTPAPGVGEALCCDVTLVSPLTRDGRPQPSSTTSAALAIAETQARCKRAAYQHGPTARKPARAACSLTEFSRTTSPESCFFADALPRGAAIVV